MGPVMGGIRVPENDDFVFVSSGCCRHCSSCRCGDGRRRRHHRHRRRRRSCCFRLWSFFTRVEEKQKNGKKLFSHHIFRFVFASAVDIDIDVSQKKPTPTPTPTPLPTPMPMPTPTPTSMAFGEKVELDTNPSLHQVLTRPN